MSRSRGLGLMLGAVAFVLTATWGCSLSTEMRQADVFAAPDSVYGATLTRHTRRAELYQDLDTVAKAWATWKSPELRSALVDASIRAYGLGKEAAEAMQTEEARASRQVWEFHVALYTPKKNWNDLEATDTFWRSHLELSDGQRLEPVQLVALSKTDKSAVQYPYVSPWTREYSIFFPKIDGAAEAEHPTLVVAGPLGKMIFAF